MAINVTFNGTTYSVPEAREVGWSSLTNYLVDLANAQVSGGPQLANLRIATTTPVTVTVTDYTVVTDLTSPGAVAVDLPVGVDETLYLIVDGKGDAATNNITITPNGAETVNDASSLVLASNNGAVLLQYSLSNTNWYVIGDYTAGTLTRTSVDQGADRVQNKDLSDDNVKFVDEADTSKALDFSLSPSTTATTTTIVANSTANRTINLPDADDTLVGKATTDVLTNKSIDGDDNTVTDLALGSLKTVLADASKFIVRDASGIPVSNTKDVPAGDVLGTSDTQSVQNKTLDNTNTITIKDTLLSIEDDGDATKILKFQTSGITTSTTRTLSVPDANTTIVGTDTTQTLTNKTFDSDLVDNYLDYNEEVAPATPPASTVRMYAKSDGRFYGKDDAGVEFSMSGSGGSSESVSTVTNDDYTVTDGDGFTTFLFSTGSTNRTLTLPTVADNASRLIKVKKIDSGTGIVTIGGEGAETIDGATTYILSSQYHSVILQANDPGTTWNNIAKYKNPSSMVRIQGANGFGSTDTMIRRFDGGSVVTITNQGADITFASSAANGATFTINRDGVYSVSYVDGSTSGTVHQGITLNSTHLTTQIQDYESSFPSDMNQVVGVINCPINERRYVTVTLRLSAGDIIRPHANGNQNYTSQTDVQFTLTQNVAF